MTADLKRSLLLVGLVTVITAWFSDLFYFPDEHFQVLEFMAHKMGVTQASALPWEFQQRIRPWFQPAVYYAIAQPLRSLGISDMFTLTFVLRLLTGVFSLAALAAFARALLPTLNTDDERRFFLRYLPLFGFLPYLFVRTASETFSAAFIALAIAAMLNNQSARRMALAGLLCGLAFESRYQAALMGLGLFAWAAIIARARIPALAAFIGGGLVALAMGLLCDRWGYGAWVFPPFDYFNVNIVQGVAAKTFGREPIFAYLYLLPATAFFAITLVVMAAMFATWVRNARHAVTWASLPFVLLHVLVAHKEARFLFPLAILAASFPVLGFASLPRLWSWRNSWAAKAITAMSLAFMAYLAVYPFGVRPHMPMAKYLYETNPGDVYSFEAPFTSYPMYRRANYRVHRLTAFDQLDPLLEKGPVLLMKELPAQPDIPGAKVTLVYSEFPLAGFGYGWEGVHFIQSYTAFARKAGFLKLLPLHWYTLYRLERSATMRS